MANIIHHFLNISVDIMDGFTRINIDTESKEEYVLMLIWPFLFNKRELSEQAGQAEGELPD